MIRRTLQNNKKMDLLGVSYVDMIDLIVKISDYVINASNAGMEFKERIKTMQGKVLTLPSEIIAEEKAKCEYLKKELGELPRTIWQAKTHRGFLELERRVTL